MLNDKVFAGLFVILATSNLVSAAEAQSTNIRQSVTPFQLTDSAGKVIEVSSQSPNQLTVICFLGTECPLARYYGPRLSKLSDEFSDRKVRFLGVNSNSHDSPKEVADFCREYRISFPISKDPANKIADLFAAKYMAEIFVLDQSLAIRYHGRVDDQYLPGITRSQPTRHDLRLAIEELLAGKPVTVAQTETAGCTIGRVKTPDPNARYTFSKEISRILNQHCVECHRPGEIAPFSLSDYNEVVGWGETMLETIDSGRMPPWNANPLFGHFQNSRVMPEEDKQVLREWVKSGMPYGTESDLPPKPEFLAGWQLGRDPDMVVKMRDRPFHIPATGTVEYQYFVVDPHLEEDKWVSAAQAIPGNRQIVHHVIVFIRPPDGSDVRGVGYLTGYVPGQRSFRLPPGHARRVPAGSKFVFQMHYTPNGLEQDDLTQVGIVFSPEPEVTHETFTLLGIDQEFEIPPYVADFPVQASLGWFPKKAELLAIIPHMHVRGKSFNAIMHRGGKREILLDVPQYDFNWQHVYELSEPLPLAEIDQIEFTARFDNSKKNPANPDPSQTVTWGDQTWEEMAIAFFEVSEPRGSESEREPRRRRQNPIDKSNGQQKDDESVSKFVDQFFQRFDKNWDGRVEKHETPLGFRRFGFAEFDSNHDEKLTRDEIEAAAKRRK